MSKRNGETETEYRDSRRVGGSRYRPRTEAQSAYRREKYRLQPPILTEAQKEARRVATYKWRATHREQALASSRAGHAKNRERENAQARAWREKQPPDYAARESAKWRAAHPEYDAAWWSKHPAKRAAKTARRRALKFMQRCGCCTHIQIEETYAQATLVGGEVDHIIPLTLGGHHCTKNLQSMTYEDHRKKTGLDLRSIAAAKRRSKLLRRWPRFSGEISSLSM